MSLGNKYNCGCGKPACGCSQSSKSKQYGFDGCCSYPVQQAPSPCCESHTTRYQVGVCLHSTCNVIAEAGDAGFYLQFSNTCEELPVDANNIFFYHPAAGQLSVVMFDGVSYRVRMVDATRAGAHIRPEDCILIGFLPASAFADTTNKCLTGKFKVPAVNQTETIYIENGQSIPIGATITFTANGETGSYTVTAYESSSSNVYAYSVQNTGNGHLAGTIIDGGCEGVCIVPIDIITNVDICDLAEANSADSISVCLNGSPRALKSTGLNDVITGNESGGWDLKKMTNLDCCVVLNGCLKFTPGACNAVSDMVQLRDVNIDCFTTAWNKANAVGQNLPMNIDGFPIVVTAYNAGTRTITVAPADPSSVTAITGWDVGQQVCLGNCCSSCLNGSQITNFQTIPADLEYSPIFPVQGDLTYDPLVRKHYLVGYSYGVPVSAASWEVKELDTTYDDNPEGNIGKPVITDPLVIRQKFCNNSDKGCDQIVELDFNLELSFVNLPAGVRAHWEVGHFAQSSATLADNTTINPFNSISTQSGSAGTLEGVSSVANDVLLETSIGTGNKGNNKYFPQIKAAFKDYVYLEKCNCGLSIIWFYVQLEVTDPVLVPAPGVTQVNLDFRRVAKISDARMVSNWRNNPNSESFNDI